LLKDNSFHGSKRTHLSEFAQINTSRLGTEVANRLDIEFTINNMMNRKVTHTDKNPLHNDLEIASLAHRALAAVQDAGRFGDRKVFISALWAMMLRLDAETGDKLTNAAALEDFKKWLLRSRRLTRNGLDQGAPLVVLARADLVAAMDYQIVAASETLADGAEFHFVLDPAVAHEAYAPQPPTPKAFVPTTRGRVGTSCQATNAQGIRSNR
jgi:hypothetical protein